jgi:ligand-binding sensor domain-containing protein
MTWRILGIRLFVLFVAASAWALPMPGLDPRIPLDEYGLDNWTNDNGLPQNTVLSVVQTSDGYIWAATLEGLVRFDGVRFTVFSSRNTPAFRSNAVSALLETPDKTLWIATQQGLIRRRGDQFLAYPERHLLGMARIGALAPARDGSLWIGIGVTIGKLRGNELRRWGIRFGAPVDLLHEDRSGRLWVSTAMGLRRFDPDGLLVYRPLPSGVPDNAVVRHVTETSDGSLWIAFRPGLVRVRGDVVEHFTEASGLPPLGGRVVLRDSEGTTWVGSHGGGLCRVEGKRLECLGPPRGFPDDVVLSATSDREGNLWAGTYMRGLVRVRDQPITHFGPARGLSAQSVMTLFEDRDGMLWSGGTGGRIDRLRAGADRFEPVAGVEVLVSAIDQDLDGTIWIATMGRGLASLAGDRLTFYDRRHGAPAFITALEAHPQGGFWVGTQGRGVVLVRNGRAVQSWGVGEGLPSELVNAIRADAAGNAWVACRGGVAVIEGDRVRRLSAPRGGEWKPGLLPHHVVASAIPGSNGRVWIATQGGLALWRAGRVTVFRKENGLPEEGIQSAIEDRKGSLWLASNFGLMRASIAELEAVAAGKASRATFERFGRADGMGNVECNHSDAGAIRTRDGKLWFATVRGVERLSPDLLRPNTVAPPVILEEARADGAVLPSGRAVRLGPGRHDLEFRYTAPSFRASERVQFHYRLEGFDRGWVEAGSRRVAYYTNLPPGSYRFQVIAANDDGVWNRRGASQAIKIQPGLHQTPWFWSTLAALIAAAAVAGHRVRLRRLQAREQMKTALVEAQLRALQAQLRPHFLFNALNSVLPLIGSDAEQARRMVLRIAELLRLSLSMEPGRLIPLEEELEVLDRYLEIERARFGPRLEVGFHIETGLERALVPMFLLQPLVENAIKHGMENRGGQGRMEVSASAEEGRLAIAVRDNGPGLSHNAAQSPWRGIGLRNTKERLERLYPDDHALALANTAGGGCEVRVTIPLQKVESVPESEQGGPHAHTHAHSR